MLPTVWDAWSARLAVDAGFAALTIGSHPLADARGAQDGEGQTFDEVLAAVAPIIAAVDVPVHTAEHTLERLAGLGVGRVTFGPLFQAVLGAHARELQSAWAPGRA